MPKGELRDSDAIRVYFEFRDSSFMDSGQIMNVLLLKGVIYAYKGNSGFGGHSHMFWDISYIDSYQIKYEPLL